MPCRLARMVTLPMTADVVSDVFERQLGRFFAAPIGQTGADRLGILKAGNVVAAEAAELGNRLAANVFQSLLVGQIFVGPTWNNQIFLGSLELTFQVRRNPVQVVIVRNVLVKRLVEVLQDQRLQIRIV